MRMPTAFDLVCVCSGKDLSAVAFERARQGAEIFQRVKLCLSREVKARPRVPEFQGCSLKPAHIGEPGAMSSWKLVVEHLHLPVSRKKKVTIQPFKIAINSFFTDDGLNAIDGRRMTLRGQPRPFFTEQTLKFVKPIVKGITEIGGCSRTHTAANRAIINNKDGFAFACQQVRGCHAGDAGTDDAHICACIFLQGRRRRRLSSGGPNGKRGS